MTATTDPQLPLGFAARPDLVAITVTVSCARCPDGGQCATCREIQDGPADGPLVGIQARTGTVHYARPAGDRYGNIVQTCGTAAHQYLYLSRMPAGTPVTCKRCIAKDLARQATLARRAAVAARAAALDTAE